MPPEIASGMPCSFTVISVMTPSVPFRADEQPGQVVAGGGFLCPPRGGDDLAVRQHHLQRQHVVLHGAVAHRVGARGTRRRHAAERGVGAGIDREEQALVAQIFVELLARDARFDNAIEILGVHADNAIHVAEVERHAALRRVDVPFERSAGAVTDDRHLVLPRRCAPRPAHPRSIAGTRPRPAAGSDPGEVLPCCSRTACEVTSRLPNLAASAAVTPSIAF
jgi:hypothetical protein